MQPFFTLRLDDQQDALVLLDQTRLPGREEYLTLRTTGEIVGAIRALSVRGAPAIGVAAAHGVYLAAKAYPGEDWQGLAEAFDRARGALAASRPTAVNLFWALERMERCLLAHKGSTAAATKTALLQEALAIHSEDTQACRSIGDHGLELLRPGMGILTHCNAGALAATAYGTALSPIYRGQERGYGFRVFSDETRPLLQGARLTAWELRRAGVDVTLCCDGMSHSLMSRGLIDACIVGCDRLAMNGDAANKVGTASLAAVAHAFGIPFYVAAPLSTLDPACGRGGDIPIEQREDAEITTLWYTEPMAPEGVKVYNPAFDVTPGEWISAIITERGVLRPPFGPALERLLS